MLKNAVVIMFDTLSYRYIGCYGNDWIKTPNFDRFAKEGVMFENYWTEGLPTIPCRRAMHTGRYTLPVAGWVPLSMEDTTIADLCWGRPIDTAIVFDCPMYRLPKFGYTRGFDKVRFFHGHEGDTGYYANDPLYHRDPDDYISEYIKTEGVAKVNKNMLAPLMEEMTSYLRCNQYWRGEEDQRCVRVLRGAAEYLRQVDRNKQFFLWVDVFDPHEPMDAPSVLDKDLPCPYDPDFDGKSQFLPLQCHVDGIYTERELHHHRMIYAEKVTVCDKYLGEFLDAFREMGFEENTLVMIVSDHGEPMGNGKHGHGILRKCRPWPYDELAHAPMWLRAPGVKAGQKLKGYVQSVDVAPTVCDWLGIGVHPAMQGKSLLPMVFGEAEKVRDFAIAGYFRFSWSLINDDWSFIHWLEKQEASVTEQRKKMYIYNDNKIRKELNAIKDVNDIPINDESEKYKKNATLDGEDQWTCTPQAVVELPEADELYDRHADPYQLHNVADKYPDVCAALLKQLEDYMAELKNS